VEDDLAWHIERERRVLLLLARNQTEREHIVAAGRHVEELGRLLRLRERLAGAIAAGPVAPAEACEAGIAERTGRLRF
jgi:hypothetical protein